MSKRKKSRKASSRQSAAKTSPGKQRARRWKIAIAGSMLAGIAAIVVGLNLPRGEAVANITVYKSPTCGCCAKWIDHLEDHDFAVKVVNRNNVTPKKQEFGVPTSLYSCHTARVGDYVVEGHVPAEDILNLLEKKPPVVGIGVAGMPIGSPGMEQGSRKDAYTVFSFDREKMTSVYARH